MIEAKVDQSRLPCSQRDTPTRAIRMHYDTFDELDRARFPGEGWDLFLRRIFDHWKRNHPPASPRKGGQS